MDLFTLLLSFDWESYEENKTLNYGCASIPPTMRSLSLRTPQNITVDIPQLTQHELLLFPSKLPKWDQGGGWAYPQIIHCNRMFHYCINLLVLSRGWMGMGVAGMMTLLVMKWIIPQNSLRLAPVSQPSSYWGIPMTPNMSCFMIHPSSNGRLIQLPIG